MTIRSDETEIGSRTVYRTNAFYRDVLGKSMFRLLGISAFLLFLLWNPIVLPPRFWNTSVLTRSITLDTTLLVTGVGLICLRKWASFLYVMAAIYLAISVLRADKGAGLLLALIPMGTVFLVFFFRRVLVRSNSLRDALLALAGLGVTALFYYAAFIIHHN